MSIAARKNEIPVNVEMRFMAQCICMNSLLPFSWMKQQQFGMDGQKTYYGDTQTQRFTKFCRRSAPIGADKLRANREGNAPWHSPSQSRSRSNITSTSESCPRHQPRLKFLSHYQPPNSLPSESLSLPRRLASPRASILLRQS